MYLQLCFWPTSFSTFQLSMHRCRYSKEGRQLSVLCFLSLSPSLPALLFWWYKAAQENWKGIVLSMLKIFKSFTSSRIIIILNCWLLVRWKICFIPFIVHHNSINTTLYKINELMNECLLCVKNFNTVILSPNKYDFIRIFKYNKSKFRSDYICTPLQSWKSHTF